MEQAGGEGGGGQGDEVSERGSEGLLTMRVLVRTGSWWPC